MAFWARQRETGSLETSEMTEQDENALHGSWVALGIRTDMPRPARVYNYLLAARGSVFIGRTHAQITDLFNGRDLVDPGVVQMSYWHPDGGTPAPNADKAWGYAGMARV
jgi:hypothetical protein